MHQSHIPSNIYRDDCAYLQILGHHAYLNNCNKSSHSSELHYSKLPLLLHRNYSTYHYILVEYTYPNSIVITVLTNME